MSIEKIFGQVKRRFPALKFGLRLKDPEDNLLAITCCFIFHNICTTHNDDFDISEDPNEMIEEVDAGLIQNNNDVAGDAIRRSMIGLFDR